MEIVSIGNFYILLSSKSMQEMKERLKQFYKNNRLIIWGVPVGAIGGYLYWYFIGCPSGACPITANPISSTLYGMLFGGLLFGLFKKEKPKVKEESGATDHVE
jgi:hypothetical protein